MAGFYIHSDVERQGPGYLKPEAAEQEKNILGYECPRSLSKNSHISIRVGSMGSMEARGRLPLPRRSIWCVGRGNGCTLAHDRNLHDRRWAPGAGEAEDGGGAAAAGEPPWAGKGFPVHLLQLRFWYISSLCPQALSDLLTPQLSSIVCGCPRGSVLRDVYSLLGEGGLRFPAIVVDTDPDCWHNTTQGFVPPALSERPD